MSAQIIHRQKTGRSFSYYRSEVKITDRQQLKRIKSLAVPPAWSNVRIALSNRAKIQASGRDKAGRKQIIYSAAYRAKQDARKYQRIRQFATQLPKIRRQIDADMRRRRLSKAKVIATIVSLIDQTYFRVGNQSYARDNHTYGVTTLRSRHTKIKGDTITFDFVGKSHQPHYRTIKDGQLARIIRQLDELPGQDIFQYIDTAGITHPIHSQDVNDYIKRHMGDEFSAKDFRTWGATVMAVGELSLQKRPNLTKDRRKIITACVKTVAKKLGNTPSVTRNSYIDPAIIRLYEQGDRLQEIAETIKKLRLQKYLSQEEHCLQTIFRDI